MCKKNCVHFLFWQYSGYLRFATLINPHHNMRLVRLRKSSYGLLLGLAVVILVFLGEWQAALIRRVSWCAQQG